MEHLDAFDKGELTADGDKIVGTTTKDLSREATPPKGDPALEETDSKSNNRNGDERKSMRSTKPKAHICERTLMCLTTSTSSDPRGRHGNQNNSRLICGRTPTRSTTSTSPGPRRIWGNQNNHRGAITISRFCKRGIKSGGEKLTLVPGTR